MPTQLRLRSPLLFIVLMTGCVTSDSSRLSPHTEQTACNATAEANPCDNAPAFLLGQFEDDYGIEYQISPETWTQFGSVQYDTNATENPVYASRPASRYQIWKWNSKGQFLIAQNDSSNGSSPGLWTRIDWMRLPDMAPFEWAFCISAYEEQSAEAAENVMIADRTVPKTGCNGHPFSRMKPLN